MFAITNMIAEVHFMIHYEKNQSNGVSQKEKAYPTKLKDTKHCVLTDKRFKIAVMKKFNELQENSEGQFNEFRNKINQRG